MLRIDTPDTRVPRARRGFTRLQICEKFTEILLQIYRLIILFRKVQCSDYY